MIFLPVLVLISGVCRGASVVESVPTFKHQVNGMVLVCDQCPPGSYMTATCTATTPTQCAQCRKDHYTELWNYLPRCLFCSTFCTDNQEEETQCSASTNRVCRCAQGFYMNAGSCSRHDRCQPGYGVQTTGTARTNTVCEKCSDGYFSNVSSTLETCVKHQECAYGQIVLLPGSLSHDTVCGSCEDLANGGETLRTFLSGIFSIHRMPVHKMKKFVTRYIRKSVPRQRGLLMDRIRAWLAQAPEKQLRNLPEMLKASALFSMAKKLKNRLRWIEEQSSNCTLNIQKN